MTKSRLSKAAKLLAFLLSCCAALPAARAAEWIVSPTGSTALPTGGNTTQGSNLIKDGDIITLLMNPTSGGPTGTGGAYGNALINFQNNATMGPLPPSFTIQSGDGNWYTLTNTKMTPTGSNSRVISTFAGGSTITLIDVILASNTTNPNGNGAAIQFASGSVANGDYSTTSAVTGTAMFIANGGTASGLLGGAIHVAAGNFSLSGSFIFDSNFAGRGGAINTAANAGNDFISGDILFTSNTAQTEGGGFNFQQFTTSTAFFNGNIQFIGNMANAGGAYATNINANNAPSQTWTIFSGTTLFDGNSATTNGGAIQQGGQMLVIKGNTTFQNNKAGGNGGAIWVYNFEGNLQVAGGNAVDLEATDGDITFQNNLQGMGSTFANAGEHNAINFYSGTYSAMPAGGVTTLTLNTSAGNSIYFYDPISISNTNSLGVTQNIVNVNVTGNGAVLFDTYQSTVNGVTNVQSGLFKLANGASYITTGATGSFTLQSAATLVAAGGGNLISAPTVNLAAGSSIVFDLLGVTPDNASLLTLNAATLNVNGWAQNFSLLNLDKLGFTDGDTVNLINLTGGAATAANLLNDPDLLTSLTASFGLTGDYSLMSLDGLSLTLLYGAYVPPSNHVITWTGETDGSWLGANWLSAGAPVKYLSGDIVNLAGVADTDADTTTVNVDTLAAANIAGMYVSGSDNLAITGNSITASATAGGFTGETAATGQLVLGAISNDTADSVDAADFTGTLTLSNASNDFQGGAVINSGVLVLANASNNFHDGISINNGALYANAANIGIGATDADGLVAPGGVAIAATGTLVFDQANAGTYAGSITGEGLLIKANNGALTLASDNSAFTGMTNLNAGSLILADNAALGGDVTVNAGNLALGVNAALGGNLTINDGGATLGNNAAIAGDATLNAGTLMLGDASSISGNVNIHSGATLGGTGTAGGPAATVTIDTGATLQVGAGVSDAQNLAIGGALALADGSILNYASITNTLFVGGAITQSGTSTINLATLHTGSYALMDVAGGLAGFNPGLLDVIYGNKQFDYNFTTDSGNQLLWLTISNITLGQNNVITWTGKTGDAIFLTSTNWSIYGIDRAFEQGDIVNLAGATAPAADPSAPFAVEITDSATAAAMYVSGTASYVLTGAGDLVTDANAGALAGSVAANGKLVLGKMSTDETAPATVAAFTGTLDLTGRAGVNTFTGGVEINNGALRISDPAQLGTTFNNLQFTGNTGNGGALIIAADMVIDDNYDENTPNRLTIGNGTDTVMASIIAEPGVTFAMSHNYSGTGGNGGAIYIAPHATLVLSGTANGAGGGFLFDSNTSATIGGAVYVSANAAAIIDSATFTGNRTAAGNNNGGGIDAEGGSVTVRDSVFSGNVTGVNNGQANGAAIGGRSGAIIDVTNVLFTSNTAGGIGGAIFNNTNGSKTTVASSTFIGNHAGSTAGAIAGQMGANGSGSVVVQDSLFQENTAGTDGGAIWFSSNITSAITNSQFQGNTAGGNGGAISLSAANDNLSVADSLFTNNSSGTNGGAIALTNANTTLAAVTSTFTGNKADVSGGAISIASNVSLTLDGILFSNNSAASGGAIWMNSGNTGTISNSQFQGNSASANGGAVDVSAGSNNLTFTNVSFSNNSTPGGGGAVYIAGNNNTGIFTNVTFTNNNATVNGGALNIGVGVAANTVNATLTDVSFNDNAAGGLGGAIYLSGNNAIFTYNVSDGLTSQIAGNTAAGVSSGIYVNNNNSIILTFNIGDGGTLDMQDPMSGLLTNNQTHVIAKNGAGTWSLGGTNSFRPANANPTAANITFNINEGTLHLYRAGETSYDNAPVAAGNIINTDTGSFVSAPRGILNFNLAAAATLSAGGGNTIQATTFNIAAGASLILDTTGAISVTATVAPPVAPPVDPENPDATPEPEPAAAPAPYSILTLSTTGTALINANGWAQNLTLANIDNLVATDGDIFDLITLTGTAGSIFTSAYSFSITDPLPEGFGLQLSDDGTILELAYSTALMTNSVITWTGDAGSNRWRDVNWTLSGTDINVNYHQGDILNLADNPALTGSTSINVNTLVSATLAGMYVSGTENYTITGTAIVGDATSGKLNATVAATGKLILGAQAAADASAVDMTAAYTGTLTLANSSNNFLGGIEINTGVLVGDNNTLGAGDIGITNNATLVFNQSAAGAYAGLINGSGTLIKTNTAALTLMADNGAYAGFTEVAAGKLLLGAAGTPSASPAPALATAALAAPGVTASVPSAAAASDAGAILGGAIQVDPGAVFGGVGAATGHVTVDTGATIQVGTGETGDQILTLAGPVTLANGAGIDYANITNTLNVGSTVDVTGTTAITIETFQSGTHNLGNISSLLGNITVTIASSDGGVEAGIGGMLPDTGARLQAAAIKDGDNLLLVGLGESRILQWTGAISGTWSTIDDNWTELNIATPVHRFMGGDRVTFGSLADTGGSQDIVNSGSNIKVSDMYVLGASSWSFSGAGIVGDPSSIVDGAILAAGDGLGRLTKIGSGTLAFNNAANNFQGGIEIDGGVVTFTAGNQLGDGGSGAGILIGADSALVSSATAGTTLATDINIAAGVTATLDTGDYNLTLNHALAAPDGSATINKTGTSLLIYTGVSDAADDLTINIDEGSMRITGGVFTGTIEAAPDTRFIAQASSTDTPDVTVGTVLIDANAGLQLNTGVALQANSLIFADSTTITTGGNAGAVSLNGTLTLNGLVTANLTSGNSVTINSLVDGEGGFLKTGVGELCLNSTDPLGNTGATQIDAGTLRITGFAGSAGIKIPIPTVLVPLQLSEDGRRFYVIPSATYFINDNSFFVFSETLFYPTTSSTTLANLAATHYTIPAESYVIPSCTVTVGGSDVVYDSVDYSLPSYTVTIPARVRTFDISSPESGTTVVIAGTAANTTMNVASTVTQNVVLNGGTFAFGTGAIPSGSAIANDASANNWMGIRLIQGDNAASSVVTGTNDIIYVGAGSQDFSIRNGIYVAVNPGDGGVTTFSNQTNNFVGSIILDSGTLLVTDTSVLGFWGTTNTAKFVLNGGALQVSGTDLITSRGMEIRADSIINVDDGLITQFGPITKGGSNLTATLYKVGSGTVICTGAVGATGLVVEEGRWVAIAFNGTPNTYSQNGTVPGTVTVYADAVFQLNGTNTSLANTIGFAGGQTYTLTGNGNNATQSCSFTGSGTLEVTMGHYNFLSPNIDIANIRISGSTAGVAINANQPMNFSPNGVITVDQGLLVLGAPDHNLGDVVLANGGEVDFMMDFTAVASTTLSVSTTFPARYENGVLISATTLPKGTVIPAHNESSGYGFKHATFKSLSVADGSVGTLGFNVNLSAGLGDHLSVVNPVSGTYNIAIYNFGAVPARYTAAVELIDAPISPDATFAPLQPVIDLGLYKYAVSTTTGPTGMGVVVTGTGAMSNGASFINQMAAMMPMSFFTELDSVSQRLGELHFEQRDGKAGVSTWLRGYGERVNYNQKVSGYGFDETKYGAEVGADYKFGGSMYNLYAGLFAGYGQSQRSYTVDGSGSINSSYAGAYETFSASDGWYLDGMLKVNNFSNQFTASSPTGESAQASYHNWAVGGSLEFGKYCDLGYGWFCEPSVQGAYTFVLNKDYTAGNMFVEQRSSGVGRARAGLQFGRVYETQKHGTVNAYFKLYAGGQWMTNGKLYITMPAVDQEQHYTPAIKGYYLQGGVGLAWQITKLTQFYFDYDTTDAEYYVKPWGLNGGVKFTW